MELSVAKTVLAAVKWLISNPDTVIGALAAAAPIAFALLRLTAWGKAHQKALLVVMKAIEEANAKGIKQTIAEAQQDETPGVNRALDHGRDVVDPKVTPAEAWKRIATELITVK